MSSLNWAAQRIVIVGPLPPPAGGMANQTRQLAELLAGEGATVEIIQVNAPYRPSWVARLKGVRALARLVPYLFRLWTAFGRSDLVHVMANSGWSWHLFAAPAIWLAALRGVPVVVNYRGGEAERFLAGHARWVGPTMRRASALVLPSGFLQGVFARHGMPGSIVPNIVNVERFRPEPARNASPSEPPAAHAFSPHLIVARNLEPIYGNDLAIKALARILGVFPNARLTLAGSGPSQRTLAALADSLGIAGNIHFTGRLDRDQMAALYRDADLMLNPTRVDNMPNSVLEAMASGLPVVCTRVGGVPFIVEQGRTAMLVPPEDPDALAESALAVLTRADLRNTLVENGLAEVQRYRWEAVRDVLAEAYLSAMAGTRVSKGVTT